MNSRSSLKSWRPRILVTIWLCLAASLWADQRYVPHGLPDGIALLAPPPLAGSEEEAADLANARAVFKGRTPAEEARARKDESLSLFLFTRAIGPVFQNGKLPKTEALFQKVKAEIGEIIDAPKNYWKRQRPYQMDTNLFLGRPEPSFSYPSGHSTRGTVVSLLLAEIFPDRKEAVLAVGREIGWDRVLIGKHFPTDIQAGRVLGKAIVRELMANPSFQHDLEQAKAEAAEALQEAKLAPANSTGSAAPAVLPAEKTSQSALVPVAQ